MIRGGRATILILKVNSIILTIFFNIQSIHSEMLTHNKCCNLLFDNKQKLNL